MWRIKHESGLDTICSIALVEGEEPFDSSLVVTNLLGERYTVLTGEYNRLNTLLNRFTDSEPEGVLDFTYYQQLDSYYDFVIITYEQGEGFSFWYDFGDIGDSRDSFIFQYGDEFVAYCGGIREGARTLEISALSLNDKVVIDPYFVERMKTTRFKRELLRVINRYAGVEYPNNTDFLFNVPNGSRPYRIRL